MGGRRANPTLRHPGRDPGSTRGSAGRGIRSYALPCGMASRLRIKSGATGGAAYICSPMPHPHALHLHPHTLSLRLDRRAHVSWWAFSSQPTRRILRSSRRESGWVGAGQTPLCVTPDVIGGPLADRQVEASAFTFCHAARRVGSGSIPEQRVGAQTLALPRPPALCLAQTRKARPGARPWPLITIT